MELSLPRTQTPAVPAASKQHEPAAKPVPAPAPRDPWAWVARWYGHVAELSFYR